MLALWALPGESLEQHLSLRKPRIEAGGAADVAIGRAVLPRAQAAGQAEGSAQVCCAPVNLPFCRCRIMSPGRQLRCLWSHLHASQLSAWSVMILHVCGALCLHQCVTPFAACPVLVVLLGWRCLDGV